MPLSWSIYRGLPVEDNDRGPIINTTTKKSGNALQHAVHYVRVFMHRTIVLDEDWSISSWYLAPIRSQRVTLGQNISYQITSLVHNVGPNMAKSTEQIKKKKKKHTH